MKKLLGLTATLLCAMCAFATTTTELWQAIGRPIGVSVQSVDKWVVTSTPSAKSDIAGMDNAEASFTLQLSGDGILSFGYQVSSEPEYDELVVKIDGSVQKRYSGNETGTCIVEIPTTGSHTVVISYAKDSSGARGEDMAIVKDLAFGGTLTIEASVESINSSQYANKNYKAVVFEEGSLLKSIASNAFKGCANLQSIELPEGLLTIGSGAFDGCSSLTNIVFPASLESLGTVDVSSLTALKELEGEGYLIRSDWLLGYHGVCPPEIVDASRLRGMAAEALKNNLYIEAFDAGLSCLVKIPDSAFENCFSLEYVNLPVSVSSIGSRAFQGCTWLPWIDIPGGCATIGDYAFCYCYSLEGVTFASGVTSIGDSAFYDDYLMTEVDLPASVERIGDNAFGGDSSLIRIGLRDSVRSQGTYSRAQALRNICSNYAHIREVTIKPGGNEMTVDFFRDCKELMAIRFLSMTAPTLNGKGASLLLNTPGELTVYVPNGSTGWVGIDGARGLPQAWPKNDTCTVRRSIAYWNVPTYLVEFDANGGSLGVQPTYQKPETAFKLPPEPKQSGYTFAGWWTSPIEGWQVTDETIFIEGVYTKLYAHWTRPHTVFLDANGGTVVKPSIQIEQSVYGVLPTPTRTGYAFDGWSYLGETVVPHMSVVTNADHTLSAQWTAFAYSVHFNPNGGTGTMAAQEFRYDSLQSLATCTYTRPGYCFAGWATSANGAVVYPDGKMVKNLSALQGGVVSLYAVWAPSYTIRFHKYDGTTTAVSKSFGYGVSTKLTSLAALGWVRGGMTLKGWATSEENAIAGKVWKPDAGIVATPTSAGTTLHVYAVWEAKPGYYVVRFNKNDGNGTWRTAAYKYGVLSTLASVENGLGWRRRGFRFKGWATSQAGANAGTVWKGDRPQIATGIPAGETKDIYAVWENVNAYSIVFHREDGTSTFVQYDFAHGVMTNLPRLPELGWARSGLTFRGWATSAANAAAGTRWKGATASVSEPCAKGAIMHVYAIWEPATGYYVIRYNKNDGSGTWRTAAYKHGTSSTLASCAGALEWSRAGYTFQGWATSVANANAGTIWKADRGTVASPTAAGTVMDVYAIWRKTATASAQASSAAPRTAASPTRPVVVADDPRVREALAGDLATGDGTYLLWLDPDPSAGVLLVMPTEGDPVCEPVTLIERGQTLEAETVGGKVYWLAR